MWVRKHTDEQEKRTLCKARGAQAEKVGKSQSLKFPTTNTLGLVSLKKDRMVDWSTVV